MSTTKQSGSRALWGGSMLLLLLVLAACRGDTTDAPRAPSEPVAAVQAMTRAVADDDLIAYARLSVPPSQYQRLQQAWAQGQSRWPLTELPLHDQLLPMLQALSAADAEAALQRSFERQLAGQATAVRQAAQSLGLFGVQYLRHQAGFTTSQQDHYVQVVETLARWGAKAPISDRARARAAIALLARSARDTGLADDAQLQQAGMEESLRRLSPFVGNLASVLASYGLDVDESLRQLEGEVVSRQGDNALVRLQYPLAGETITLQIPLTRREGHWYLTRTLADTDALLRRVDAENAPITPPVGPAAPSKDAATASAGP